MIKKSSISITLTPAQSAIITEDAKKHGRSISSEIGYMIENNAKSQDTFKVIFAELASLKKNIQDRFGASSKVEPTVYSLREKTVCIHRLLNIAGSLEKEKEYSVEEISARAGLDEGIIQSTIDSLGIFKKNNNKYLIPDEP